MSEIKFTYDYRDSAGELMYQVCRMEPKGFRQRRPNPAFNPKEPRSDSNEAYIYNLEGVTPTIYRLPELLSAMKKEPKRYVLILEGEKDCDLAWRNGVVATTNSGGVLKWRDEFSQYLKEFQVVIIPDNDPIQAHCGYSPGKRHSNLVAASLHAAGVKFVKIVQLPGVPENGGDFTDWWTAMADLPAMEKKKKFVELIKAAAQWAPDKQLDDGSPESRSGKAPVAAKEPVKEKESVKESVKEPVKEPVKADTNGVKPAGGVVLPANSQSDLEQFISWHRVNFEQSYPANEEEWFGKLRANYLLVESMFLRPKEHGVNFRDAIFALASEAVVGIPVVVKP